MVDLLLDPQVRSVLGEGRQAFVAVPARSGPHVTPELYATSDGRLWLASAAATLKAKVLTKRPYGSAAVRAGSRSVVMSGPVETFDAHDAGGWLRATRQGPSVARGLGHFGLRNASDLAGFLVDAARGRAGRPPGRRILLALRPDRVALVDGGRLVGAWGDWPGPRTIDEADAAPSAGVDAVVGWDSDVGPLALPAQWDADDGVAHVPAALAELAGVGAAAAACVVADEYGGPGPAAKAGVLLRGEGRRSGGDIRIDTERVTTWDGIETATEPVS